MEVVAEMPHLHADREGNCRDSAGRRARDHSTQNCKPVRKNNREQVRNSLERRNSPGHRNNIALHTVRWAQPRNL